MWIFTREGFFSVVVNRQNNRQLIVRARFEEDIFRLAGILNVAWENSKPSADYPFRLVCTKNIWGNFLLKASEEIDYENFKNEMANHFSPERINQLYTVWKTMATPIFESDNSQRAADADARRIKSMEDDFDSPLHRD